MLGGERLFPHKCHLLQNKGALFENKGALLGKARRRESNLSSEVTYGQE